MQWFRWYHGTCADPKLGSIARRTQCTRERVIAVWAIVLESASEASERGAVRVDADGIADVLNCDSDSVARILGEFESRGMIRGGHVVKWEARQPARDDSSDRVKRHRAKKKAEEPDDVTRYACDETDTATPPEIDREIDGEGELIHPSIQQSAREGGGMKVPESLDGQIDLAMRYANRGISRNPRIPRDVDPIRLSHKSRQDVADWIKAGIPLQLICLTVQSKAEAYEPDGENNRPRSMAYFGPAVRDAWTYEQSANLPEIAPDSEAARIAADKRRETPGRGRTAYRQDTPDAAPQPVSIEERRAREARDAAAASERREREDAEIQRWEAEHELDARRLRATVKAEFDAGPMARLGTRPKMEAEVYRNRALEHIHLNESAA